jgi:protease-4
MKTFFSSCLGTVVGLLLFLGLCLVFLVGSVNSETEVAISDNSVLAIRLDKPITELELEDPLAEVFPGSIDESIGLIQLKQAILDAKNDSKIKGIYLNAPFVITGFASLQEIRESLIDFKSTLISILKAVITCRP